MNAMTQIGEVRYLSAYPTGRELAGRSGGLREVGVGEFGVRELEISSGEDLTGVRWGEKVKYE